MDSLEPRPSSCRVSVVELTFDPKREQPLDPSELAAALEAGRFVWIDVEIADPNEAEQVLAQLALLNHEIIQDALFGNLHSTLRTGGTELPKQKVSSTSNSLSRMQCPLPASARQRRQRVPRRRP